MADIPQRTLGSTGLQVTALGYGAMELRGKPRGRDLDEGDVGRLLNTVLDAGINLVDTSIDYGLSEERIGRHISHRRDEYTLATKCGCLVGWEPTEEHVTGFRGGGPHDYSRENVVAGVEQSLRRLRTDHLDIVQVHASPEEETLRRDRVVETLQDLQQQGKIRFIGMSGTLPNLTDHIAMGAFSVFQIPYSAMERAHEDVISDAARSGAGVIIRGGVARGAPSREERAVQRNPQVASSWERSGLGDLLDGMSPMELMLRFTISHPDMSTTIVGTANPQHLTANVDAAAKGPLPEDLYDEVKRRLSEAGIT